MLAALFLSTFGVLAPELQEAPIRELQQGLTAATAELDAAAAERDTAGYRAASERIQELAPQLAAAVTTLLEVDRPWSDASVRIAWECGVALAETGQVRPATEVQRALHAELRATWTVLNLSLTLMRAGDYEEADSVLAEQYALATTDSEQAAIVYQRALVALGRGVERQARDYLGWALRLGSEDATVVLAWLQRHAGRSASARSLVRAQLGSAVAGNAAWALRTWGLSLIPDRPSRAAGAD